MKVVSVNVGLPREVQWREDLVETGIHKAPVSGRITVCRLNLEGDRQADLSVHGGPEKAVYAYPVEHYAYWREELPGVPLPWGAFGENLSIQGFQEDRIRVGDVFRIGTTELVVTQPRLPCFKLNLRFQRSDMVRRFLKSGRTGFYFAVLKEGELKVGDGFELVPAAGPAVSIPDIVRLYATDRNNRGLLQRAVETAGLPQAWRDYFNTQLSESEERDSSPTVHER
jgi:MOSC domain-containing protein YiiM